MRAHHALICTCQHSVSEGDLVDFAPVEAEQPAAGSVHGDEIQSAEDLVHGRAH